MGELNPLFDFSYFPTVTTERLVLREFRLSDAANILIFRGDPEVQKYNSDPLMTLAQAEEYAQWNIDEFKAMKSVPFAVCLKESDRAIGSFGIYDWNRHHRRAMFGYDMAKDCWGNGYAAEAAWPILEFAFAKMNMNRLDADTLADNWGSVRLLAKLGFIREGVRKAYSWEDVDNSFHDGSINRLLRDDFDPNRDERRVQ